MAARKRKRRSVTLTLGEGDFELLEQLAALHECLWGNKPSVSRFMTDIAQGGLIVARKGGGKKSETG